MCKNEKRVWVTLFVVSGMLVVFGLLTIVIIGNKGMVKSLPYTEACNKVPFDGKVVTVCFQIHKEGKE